MINLLVAFLSFLNTINIYISSDRRRSWQLNTIIIIEILTMPVENIQYSEKYCDDSFEYRYIFN